MIQYFNNPKNNPKNIDNTNMTNTNMTNTNMTNTNMTNTNMTNTNITNTNMINFISNKIQIIKTKDYHKIQSIQNINKNDLLIIEYPEFNLFGEKNIDRTLQMIQLYLINKNNKNIIDIYPRTYNYKKTEMIKCIHNLIKSIKNIDLKLYNFFQIYSKEEIEFYFAKYLYNAFEGNNYGPLTLPIIAKINHSCNPNVRFTFNKDNGCMYVYANRNINKYEEIYDSYIENKKIKDHKIYLQEHYGFSCDC